ncbi:hypothetical protein AB0E69_05610 [Kribbella sp. NPDC026611]|uniref:hypothetical protein n=1 Tax=Kribbella sp. NPDC026611 TaxID=3154911 RepID=UPI0033EF8C1C
MGLFKKKPDVQDEVIDEYIEAVRAWCRRLREARDGGADVTVASAIIAAAGEVPQLAVERLALPSQRDLAISTARAWLSMEAGRLSRQDVLNGRSESYWVQIGDLLYSDLPLPSY